MENQPNPQPEETQVSVMRPTWVSLADDLETWHETLAFIELQLESCSLEERTQLLEEKREVEAGLQKTASALRGKTDSTAAVIRKATADIAFLKDEEQRIYRKRKAAERALDWLKSYVLEVMRRNEWGQIKTATNTLAERKNGGLVPLIIDNEALISEQYRRVTISIPFFIWKIWREWDAIKEFVPVGEISINNAAIRGTLEDGGTVTGARLGERSTHLRVL